MTFFQIYYGIVDFLNSIHMNKSSDTAGLVAMILFFCFCFFDLILYIPFNNLGTGLPVWKQY